MRFLVRAKRLPAVAGGRLSPMPFILHRSRDNIILHARLRYTDAADADRTPEGHLNRRKFVADSVATFAAGSSFLPLTFSDAPSTEGVMGSSRTFTLDAKPTSITLDTAKTAIVVVDMQDDFGTKGGMFDRAGIDISLIQRAVPTTARVLAAGRKAGIKVVYLKMAYKPDLSDMGAPGSPNRRVHEQIMHVGTTVRAPNGAESRILVPQHLEQRHCQ